MFDLLGRGEVGGGMGGNPIWCLSTPAPEFVLTPLEKIVKLSQKYIADPLWFSHKSNTDNNNKNDLAKKKKIGIEHKY